jgi:hypothetical protein
VRLTTRTTYHFARLIDRAGNVSPICADPPRKINLTKETWTIRKQAVTCKQCRTRLKQEGR